MKNKIPQISEKTQISRENKFKSTYKIKETVTYNLKRKIKESREDLVLVDSYAETWRNQNSAIEEGFKS